MSMWYSKSDFEEDPPEQEEVELDEYIAVRRITYEMVTPPVKVAVGELVPKVITKNPQDVQNLLSKGAIRKKE